MNRSIPLAFTIAGRELRAGLSGFRVFLVSLALGVAAIAAVGVSGEAVTQGLNQDATRLLGGDLDVRLLNRPADADQLTAFDAVSTRRSLAVDMRSMITPAGGGNRSLVEMKAVDSAYPLVGTVVLNPPMTLVEALGPNDTGRYGAVAEPYLVEKLSLKPGDAIQLGGETFEFRATLESEPDRVASLVRFGPRFMISIEAVDATGLIQPGSQVHYHYRMLVDPALGGKAAADRLNESFPKAGWRIQGPENAAPGVRRFIDRMTLFLSFVGLTTLLVGGIGVAGATASYLEGKTGTIATLKCLGAPANLVFQAYLIQVLALGGLGTLIGVAAGWALPTLALASLDHLLPVQPMLGLYPTVLAASAAFGLLTALTFALWPLGRSREVPAAALFRDRLAPTDGEPRLTYRLATLGCAGALMALTILTANDRAFASWFVIGALVTLASLRLGAALIQRFAKRAKTRGNARLRLALANLHRPGAPTVRVVVSLGLGLSVLVAVALIEGNLNRQVAERLPDQAPAFFFIDIQPDQGAAFDAAINGVAGTHDYRRVATLRGRIVKIDGVPVDQVDVAPESQWAIRGDRALTYAREPGEDSLITKGEWWPVDYNGPPLISLDANLARGFGVDIGDTLTVNVLGSEITGEIRSLRDIDWRSLRFDFALIFSPGVLEAAPHSFIAAVHAPPEAETQIDRAIAKPFPNVTAVRVREALDAAKNLLEGIGWAVRGTAAITLVAGAVVLAGALAAARQRRIRDSVIFKVLGATRSRVIGVFLLEYGLLGLLTGLVAVVVGGVTAWAVVTLLMRADWMFLPGTAALTASIAVVITLIFGLMGTIQALNQKPSRYLRNP